MGRGAINLRRIGSAGTLVAGAAWLGPWASAHEGVRRRLLPRMAGRGPTDRVALTFDDGPDPASTPAFVQALDDLGWRATFFLLGSMTLRAPRLAAEIVAAGHDVAVHGHEHRSHLFRSPWDIRDDLHRSVDTIADATGVAPGLFRPPFGSVSGGSIAAARGLGLRTVLWSAWGRDWTAHATAASVADDLRRTIEPGGTILLHDSDCTSTPGSWRSALGALPLLADELEGRGLRVVALDEHLGGG